MHTEREVSSGTNTVRLLEVGIVLEELFKQTVRQRYNALREAGDHPRDGQLERLVVESVRKCDRHVAQLTALLAQLDGETDAYREIERRSAERVGCEVPSDADDLVTEYLEAGRSTYRFYDALVRTLEDSLSSSRADETALLPALRTIRAEEARNVDKLSGLVSQRTS